MAHNVGDYSVWSVFTMVGYLLLFWMLTAGRVKAFCPGTCQCHEVEGGSKVICSTGYWNEIPPLPDGVLQLEMSKSNFSTLKKYAFGKHANTLDTVRFTYCNITQIEAEAFHGMIHLLSLKINQGLFNITKGALKPLVRIKVLSMQKNNLRLTVPNGLNNETYIVGYRWIASEVTHNCVNEVCSNAMDSSMEFKLFSPLRDGNDNIAKKEKLGKKLIKKKMGKSEQNKGKIRQPDKQKTKKTAKPIAITPLSSSSDESDVEKPNVISNKTVKDKLLLNTSRSTDVESIDVSVKGKIIKKEQEHLKETESDKKSDDSDLRSSLTKENKPMAENTGKLLTPKKEGTNKSKVEGKHPKHDKQKMKKTAKAQAITPLSSSSDESDVEKHNVINNETVKDKLLVNTSRSTDVESIDVSVKGKIIKKEQEHLKETESDKESEDSDLRSSFTRENKPMAENTGKLLTPKKEGTKKGKVEGKHRKLRNQEVIATIHIPIPLTSSSSDESAMEVTSPITKGTAASLKKKTPVQKEKAKSEESDSSESSDSDGQSLINPPRRKFKSTLKSTVHEVSGSDENTSSSNEEIKKKAMENSRTTKLKTNDSDVVPVPKMLELTRSPGKESPKKKKVPTATLR